jgi:hypothetical protein
MYEHHVGCFACLNVSSRQTQGTTAQHTKPQVLQQKPFSSFQHLHTSFIPSHTTYLIPLISPLTPPLTPLHMPLQRLLHIAQTPLILTLRLTQRHQEILLARLLLIRRTLALGKFLLLALCRRRLVVCFAVALGHGDFLFFGVFLAERSSGFDGFGGDGFVGVALREELGAFVRGESGRDCVCFLEGAELFEVGWSEDGGGEEFGDGFDFWFRAL